MGLLGPCHTTGKFSFESAFGRKLSRWKVLYCESFIFVNSGRRWRQLLFTNKSLWTNQSASFAKVRSQNRDGSILQKSLSKAIKFQKNTSRGKFCFRSDFQKPFRKKTFPCVMGLIVLKIFRHLIAVANEVSKKKSTIHVCFGGYWPMVQYGQRPANCSVTRQRSGTESCHLSRHLPYLGDPSATVCKKLPSSFV